MSEKIEAFIVLFLLRTFGFLPLSLARNLGVFFGHVLLLLNVRAVKVTRTNIDFCYPQMSDTDKQQLVKKSVIETAKLAMEAPIIGRKGWPWLEKRISQIVGQELVDSALAEKKGLLLLGPHLGNWEVVGLFLPKITKITSMYLPPKKAYLEDYARKFRESSGAELVPTNQRGVAKVLSALKKGETTGVLPDQVPHAGGEFAPFFNTPAYTMTFIHKLIERTDCRVLCTFAKRTERGFEIVFTEPDSKIYSDDQDESLAALNKSVENCIALCPEQYQWEYKRFRKTEPGGKRRYRSMK